MKKFFAFLIALLLCAMFVRADEAADYRAFADTVRADVYAMDLPAFKVRTIPDKYKGESAVILAVYEGVDAKKKTGVGVRPGFMMLPTISPRARVEFSRLTRMLIHINDKSALEKYSEFDFSKDSKRKIYEGYEKNRHTMGVRVLKADGRVIDIDGTDFVDVESGKKGENKGRKLAIPGLEVGDDIDVFFYTESKLQNVHPDPMEFYLKDTAPILNYQIHCIIDDNLSTQYRTLNGAPDFTVSRDEAKNYVLDLELTDIDAREPRLWYSSEAQSPHIRMYVFNRRNSEEYTPKSARKDGLQPNPDVDVILEDRWDMDDWMCEKGNSLAESLIKSEIRDGGKILKELDRRCKSGELSDRQVADYIYNLLVYDYYGLRDKLAGKQFAGIFQGLLTKCKIKAEMGLASAQGDEPLDQVLDNRRTIYFTRIPDGAGGYAYYFPPVHSPRVMTPGEVGPALQGRKATLWRKKKERKLAPAQFFDLPAGSYAENRNLTEVEATPDGTMLKVKRTEAYSGATKSGIAEIVSWEDIDKGYTAWLNRYGLSPEVKLKSKKKADLEARYADERKQQLDDFRSETESYHGSAPAEFHDARVTALGIDSADPAFRYEADYTMDNYVKRAGKNLIVSVGKLLSGQTEVLPADREREDDIYMPYPREYATVIRLKLPDGYRASARSLAALGSEVSNKAGAFTVTASADEPGEVRIEVVKRYSGPVLTAADWPALLEILDSAAKWNATTLLLEKR